MNNIKWKDEAVFYANGTQFREGCGGFQRYNDILESWQRTISGDELDKTLKSKGFQLNEMRIGDYIEASELDTEQKYNDAVEVFELFGFEVVGSFGSLSLDCHTSMYASVRGHFVAHNMGSEVKRKITYSQLMAIGKLKRAMIEKSAPKIAPDLTPDVVNKPSHYQFFEGVEVIEIIASSMTCEQFKGYCLGNRIKYRLRAGNKDDIAQEIAKSDKYVELYDEHKHLCK